MKKILSIILTALLFCLALAGCGGKTQNGGANAGGEDLTPPPKLSAPQNLFVWENGEYAIWNSVENASGYVLKIKNTEIELSGSPANISEYTKYAGVYDFCVKAKGDKVNFSDSDWSAKKLLIIPPKNDRLRISSKTIWGYDGTALTTAERDASELILLNALDTTVATCTAIGQSAFSGENVTLIYITAPIASIGTKAFFNCKKLTSAVLPKELSVISDLAFYGAAGLSSVTLEAAVPPALGNNVFPNNAELKFLVPEASLEAYKTAWPAFADKIFAA